MVVGGGDDDVFRGEVSHVHGKLVGIPESLDVSLSPGTGCGQGCFVSWSPSKPDPQTPPDLCSSLGEMSGSPRQQPLLWPTLSLRDGVRWSMHTSPSFSNFDLDLEALRGQSALGPSTNLQGSRYDTGHVGLFESHLTPRVPGGPPVSQSHLSGWPGLSWQPHVAVTHAAPIPGRWVVEQMSLTCAPPLPSEPQHLPGKVRGSE